MTTIKKLVNESRSRQTPVSTQIHLDVLPNFHSDERKEIAFHKMINLELGTFASELIKLVAECHDNDAETSQKARGVLQDLFGEKVLSDEAITSRNGFFFTLTSDGKQFRAWYSTFGRVTPGHFDSCGSGCLFTATCESPETLKEWITPLLIRKVEFESKFLGKIWIGCF